MVLCLTLALVATVPVAVQGHSPSEPEHGINNSTFVTLWSLDADVAAHSDTDALVTIGSQTDVPFDQPPDAVRTWNDGESEEFPSTGLDRSLVPAHASPRDSGVIRDAHATISLVQPSTQVHLTDNEGTLYVGTDGNVTGFIDYRVSLPATRTSDDGNVTVTHSLSESTITDTRLYVDDQLADSTFGSQTPELAFEEGDFASRYSTNSTVRFEADIATTWEREREACATYNNTTATCTARNQTTRERTQTTTVSDSIRVRPHDIELSGYVGQFPDGDRGVVAYTPEPWVGFERNTATGSIHGVWRFYTARDPRWDTLDERTSDSTERVHSPVHPLTVHSFPMEVGPTASPRSDVAITEAFGGEQTPPTLPDSVALDVVESPYTATFGIATRWRTHAEDHDPSEPLPDDASIRAIGLVRGVEQTRPLDEFETIPINESAISLRVQTESTDTGTTSLQVTLSDAQTGVPIRTSGRDGYLTIGDERVNTTANGTANVTIPREQGSVSARYHPSAWWRRNPAYTGSQTSMLVGGSVLDVLGTLSQFVLAAGLFGIGVFLIDRITGWGVWPPWRFQ